LTYDDVMRRISGGGMVTFERVDPSFCRPWCPDRSPIDGSDKWPRCMVCLASVACSTLCCVLSFVGTVASFNPHSEYREPVQHVYAILH
jgi:hypothetical protein